MSEREPQNARGGMTGVLLACCAVGAITVAVTWTLGLRRYSPASANVPAIATEEYGKRLLAQTAELLGPHNPDPNVKSRFLNVFSRPERLTACACERASDVTLVHTLHLLSDNITNKIRAGDGRLAQMLKAKV